MGPHCFLLEHRQRRPPALRPLPAIIFVLVATLLPVIAGAAEIKARLTPQTFALDEPSVLAISVSGQQAAQIELPEVDGLVFHRRGQNRQFQMINGAISSSITHNYHVQALRTGTYTIPAITVIIDGTSHQTGPLTCTVTGSGAPSTEAAGPDEPAGGDTQQLAFIRLLPEKDHAYLNEVVPATVKAYFQSGIKVNLTTLPTLKSDGVLLEILEDEPAQQQETIDATSYNVVTWETALTGIKEGRHQIGLEAAVTLLLRSRQQRPPPGFGLFDDPFFDDAFSRFEHRPLTVSAPTLPFTVEPLPNDGRPAGFSGAIGSFRLDLTAHPESVEVGEPITLTMTVSGSGNFDTVTAPELGDRHGLKTYTPAATFHPAATPQQGKKVFEQAVIVTDGALRSLPPVVFSYFDPEQGHYLTLQSAPLPVSVSGAPEAPPARQQYRGDQELERPPPGPVAEPAVSSAAALAPVKAVSTASAPYYTPLFLRPWFMVALPAAVLAILGVSVVRFRAALLRARPERLRARAISRARRRTLARLNEIGGATMKEQDYLVDARQLARDFLAVLWQRNAASLTTADINRRLGPDSPVTTLFRLADRQAYGGMALREQERRRLHDDLTSFIATCP